MRGVALGALMALLASAAWAEPVREIYGPLPAPAQLSLMGWLAPAPDLAETLTRKRPRDIPRNLSALTELGRLAFRYPGTLGGTAARGELSCDVCHPAGGAQTRFFAAPLSDKPGRVDLTNAFFSASAEDGLKNPKPIANLKKAKPPYGSIDPIDELRPYIARKIRTTFAGMPAHPLVLDALTAYVRALALKPTSAAKDIDPAALIQGAAAQHIVIAFDDLDRAMGVIDAAIETHDGALIAFTVAATRSELGRLDERLDPQDPAHETLKTLSDQLREVTRAVKRDNLKAAKGFSELIRERLVIARDEILSRADLTFFNTDYLDASLDTSKPHPLDPPLKIEGLDTQ